MKKIILPTVMIATMMATASLFVQDSDCKAKDSTKTKVSEIRKISKKEIENMKQRFEMHEETLSFFREALDYLSSTRTDIFDRNLKKLLRRLDNEISKILQNPGQLDSDLIESLRKIEAYLDSKKSSFGGKKLKLAKKIIEKLKKLLPHPKLEEEVIATPAPEPTQPTSLKLEGEEVALPTLEPTQSASPESEEEETPPPTSPRPQWLLDKMEQNKTLQPLPPRSQSTPLKLEEEETPPPLPPRSASAPVPQVPEDYAVAPTPSPAPTSLEVPEEYRSAPTPPPAPTTLSASVSKTEPKGITVNDIQEVHLKKTGDSAEKSASTTLTTTPPEEVKNSASNDLMTQIRAGKRLKTREERDEELKKKGIPTTRNGGVSAKDQALDTSTSLFNAIRGRRISMREDEEEEGDDSEWNDD